MSMVGIASSDGRIKLSMLLIWLVSAIHDKFIPVGFRKFYFILLALYPRYGSCIQDAPCALVC